MPAMFNLKPCPFCGAEAMTSFNTVYDYQAYCTNDSCFMSKITMEDMETEEQAIAAWNKRTFSVPAVSLDKLCEWLAKNAILKCSACMKYFKNCVGSCGDSSEHWEMMLTKWMEEVNKNDA